MVPPNLTLIQEKSDTILRCLQRIRKKTPSTFELLEDDIDAHEAKELLPQV